MLKSMLWASTQLCLSHDRVESTSWRSQVPKEAASLLKPAHAECLAHCRLRDVLWDHTQLYLIMDYVEQDLRQFMDTDARSRSLRNVKVATTNQCLSSSQ